ncbi:peptidase [Burkholderia pseudomallei]
MARRDAARGNGALCRQTWNVRSARGDSARDERRSPSDPACVRPWTAAFRYV